jgi:hypothetical protein
MESGCWTEGVFQLLGWAADPWTTPVRDDKGEGDARWRAVADQEPFSSPWMGRRPVDHCARDDKSGCVRSTSRQDV